MKKIWFFLMGLSLGLLGMNLYVIHSLKEESKTVEPLGDLNKIFSLCQIEDSNPTLTIQKESTKLINNKIKFPSLNSTIEKVDSNGLAVINNPTSNLVLVNKSRKLPDGYIPKNLIVPSIHFPFNENSEKKYMTKVAATAITLMFQDAQKQGIYLYGVSGYRSYTRQVNLFNYYVETNGLEETRKVSAEPGTSEHQTGLAIDVSSESNSFELTENFGETKEGKWLAENAHKYGFIIRYPKGKETITGYSYEPWHIRYIGVPYATYLYNNNLTLEEVIK